MRFERAVSAVRERFGPDSSVSPEQVAARLVQECATVTHCDGAGMSLMTDRGAQAVLAATDEVALRLEELQFNFGEGPCTMTIETRAPALYPDLEAMAREWSLFAGGGLALGVRAVFAFPLRVEGSHLGALELYRTEPGDLRSGDYFQALVYAEAALELLVYRQAGEQFAHLYPYLTRAIDDRLEVHHAVGMIAVQAGVTTDEALSLLRGYAFSHFQTVMEVALEVVDGELNFGPN